MIVRSGNRIIPRTSTIFILLFLLPPFSKTKTQFHTVLRKKIIRIANPKQSFTLLMIFYI